MEQLHPKLENELITRSEIKQKWLNLSHNFIPEGDEWLALDLSLLMENQRLMNDLDHSDNMSQFKRISIPLVRRIFNETWPVRKLCQCWTYLGPTGPAYWQTRKGLKTDPSSPVVYTKKLRSELIYEAVKDLRAQTNLDIEDIVKLAKDIQEEITADVIKRILAAAAFGIIARKKNLEKQIINVSKLIKSETGKKANWIVASKEIAKLLGIEADDTASYFWDTFNLIINPSLNNQLLIGYKGEDQFDAGFIYVNYVPLSASPMVLDPDSFIPRRSLLHRFGIGFRPKNGIFHFGKVMIRD